MAEDGRVPLAPVTKNEIHRLESALLVTTLFRPEVLEALESPEERLTWVDSLAVAAAAYARHKAGVSASRIAEELGRSEHSIQQHIQGRTKAGRLVQESYRLLVRREGKIEIGVEAPVVLDEAKLRELAKKLEEALRAASEAVEELKSMASL